MSNKIADPSQAHPQKPNSETLIGKLTSFGLSPIESRIYLSLIQNTDQTIVQIAKETKIPRTTLYEHIQSLIKRGLVEQIIRYKSQSFKAFPIDILQNLIVQEQKRVEHLGTTLTELKRELPLLSERSSLPETQVRYYHGASGFRQMMMHSLEAVGEFNGYSEFGRAHIVGQKFVEQWAEEVKKRHIIDRVITKRTKEIIAYLSETEQFHLRKEFQRTRFLDEKLFPITGDVTMYNNTFAASWWTKGEVVGVEIENPEFVKLQKSIFELLWNIAKPLK
jgi:predicted DNA-binding transcriptional regulator